MVPSAVIGASHLLDEESCLELVFVDPVFKEHDGVRQETLGPDASVFFQTDSHEGCNSICLTSSALQSGHFGFPISGMTTISSCYPDVFVT